MMHNMRSLVAIFKKMLYILNKKQRMQGFFLLLSLLLTAILEMMGISIIIPLFLAIMQPEKLMEYNFINYSFDMLGLEKTGNTIIGVVLILVILIYLIKNLCSVLVAYYQYWFRNCFSRDLSVKMLKICMQKPYPYFLDVNSADILRGIETDSINITEIFDAFCNLASECLVLLIIGLFMIYLSPGLALFLLFISVVASLLLVVGMKGKVYQYGEKQREVLKQKTQYSYQTICGIKDITVMNRRKEFIKGYEIASDINCKCHIGYQFIKCLPSRFLEVVFIVALTLLVMYFSTLGDDLTVYMAKLSAIALASLKLLPQVSAFSSNINTLIFYRPSMEATYKEFRNNAEDFQNEETDNNNTTICLNKNWKKLIVRNVYWKYQNSTKYVLNDLSIEIEKGESIAFIGESGAGKTTLADMILGLLKPQSGEILVDGSDIYGNLEQWATMIGYVPQSVFLIDGSIKDNIVFSMAEGDEKQVWSALEKAQLKDFVLSLPNGLETVVGERGVKLSGGQRQRIAIARALYYNPQILVLDEATAALDNETENAVMDAINKLQREKTLIVIAHRLSTIRNCDRIFEVINGKAILKSKHLVLEDV